MSGHAGNPSRHSSSRSDARGNAPLCQLPYHFRMSETDAINSLLRTIERQGHAPASYWPRPATLTPRDLGLHNDGMLLRWRTPPDLLDANRIERALPGMRVDYFPLIDSTNTRMMLDGQQDSVAGRLYLAEFQYGGRGRRGRAWLSPYARNLSMTLGGSTSRQLSELGGLSIVVGVALASALEDLGVSGVQLKWPNDILVDGRKLCGVLVELLQRDQTSEFVVGIGVNVSLSDAERHQINQPVTDLRSLGNEHSRTDLAIRLMQTVSQYLALFDQEGFAVFVEAFNSLHKFHRQSCEIIQGADVFHGVVTGIGEQGELILDENQRFHGGEVSLRSG